MTIVTVIISMSTVGNTQIAKYNRPTLDKPTVMGQKHLLHSRVYQKGAKQASTDSEESSSRQGGSQARPGIAHQAGSEMLHHSPCPGGKRLNHREKNASRYKLVSAVRGCAVPTDVARCQSVG